MSTILSVECKCAICGATNLYKEIASTSTFGGPDLDLRPAEMKRSTMPLWIQECPGCGYVSGRISDEACVTREWLRSERYLTCDGIVFVSELARQFYKGYLIQLENENPEGAFWSVLRAAWASDDKMDSVNAKICREHAIPLATELIERGSLNRDNILLVRADLMRRSGQFDELLDKYASVRFDTELMNQILNFELQKAEAKDVSRYRVKDVTGDSPAPVTSRE